MEFDNSPFHLVLAYLFTISESKMKEEKNDIEMFAVHCQHNSSCELCPLSILSGRE